MGHRSESNDGAAGLSGLQQKYGVKTIYLATDSAKVIESTKQYPDFDFVYLDIDRRHFANDDLDGCHKSGQCDSIEDMRTMLLDLAFMVESDFFIGAFSTNVARLAYELMAARKQCYPPFISMDIPWCHNGGSPTRGGWQPFMRCNRRPVSGPSARPGSTTITVEPRAQRCTG